MVKHLILFILCQFALPTFAQHYERRFAAGFSAGVNTAFTDLPQRKQGITNTLSLAYEFSPFIAMGI